MIGETEDILWRDLMWTERKTDRFTIDSSRIQDNLADVQRDGSFINNPANDFGGKETWMFDRMTAAKRSKRLVGRDRDSFSMSKVRGVPTIGAATEEAHARGDAHEWWAARSGTGDHAASIPEWGLAGAELLCRRWSSHLCDAIPQVAGHVRRAKGYPAIYPMAAGPVFAVYLLYVQPWLEELDQQTNGLPRSDHIWHDKNGSWTTYHLTKALREETAIRMGLELTTSGYRHVAVEMGREYV